MPIRQGRKEDKKASGVSAIPWWARRPHQIASCRLYLPLSLPFLIASSELVAPLRKVTVQTMQTKECKRVCSEQNRQKSVAKARRVCTSSGKEGSLCKSLESATKRSPKWFAAVKLPPTRRTCCSAKCWVNECVCANPRRKQPSKKEGENWHRSTPDCSDRTDWGQQTIANGEREKEEKNGTASVRYQLTAQQTVNGDK